MAQYQHNFYGSSYYGNTNAFSGTYETEEILTQQPLNSTVDLSITAVLPSVSYSYTATQDIVRTSGTWTDTGTSISSNTASAKLTFTATCDRVTIWYKGRIDGTTVTVKITTTLPGGSPTISTTTFSSVNATTQDQTYIVDGLGYGSQLIEISLDPANAAETYFYFQGIDVRVAHFTAETKARLDTGAWTTYVPLTLTFTPIVDRTDAYTVTGTSTSYSGNNKVQVRLWLASSDNTVTPQIEKIETSSGNTLNRAILALWTAQINMISIATALSLTFSQILNISFTQTTPANTKITLSTRSSPDATLWSASSAPYSATTARLRLKDTKTSGYIITPLINPASTNAYLRINKWETWSDVSYLPPDESGVGITYIFLDENNTILFQVDQPKYIANRRFYNTAIANKPYRLKIQLTRRFDKASPVIDSISLISSLIYEEKNIVDNFPFSAVDNSNTGEQVILDMSTLTFHVPTEATSPLYYLEDNTQRPLDILLYLDSVKNLDASLTKPNWTSLTNDKVWAKVKVNTNLNPQVKTGILKHFQYGGGSAVYQAIDQTEMAASFTPVLESDKQYRYYLIPGWYDAVADNIVTGSANINVVVYWKTEQATAEASRTHITQKSSHNEIIDSSTDTSSDIIMASVSIDASVGTVPWASEEKIYFGSCNVNDLHNDYVRKHTIPTSGDSIDTSYVVQAGDTYVSIATNFGVDSTDIMILNNASISSNPIVGSTILVPSRIVLPKIDPAATITSNPYVVDVIYNSVQQGGRIVSESRISRKVLSVIENEVTIQKEAVTRGSLSNGKDFLKNAKVTQVLGIWNIPNDPVVAPNYVLNLDYLLSNNQIDWSPTAGGAIEPTAGNTYYVSYKCMKPTGVQVTMGSDYQEQGGIDSVWRSPEVKEFSGTCAPDVPFKVELPNVNTWQGATNPNVQNLTYMIEDNDLWVKTWVNYDPVAVRYYANGSLQDRIPKDNWFPLIRSGYYYSGEDEYYLYSEPTTYVPATNDIPRAQSISYVPARYNNGVKLQSASTNLVHNSGFDVASGTNVVFWKGFNTTATP